MGHRVEIDKATCQSSGHCVNEEPDAFGFDDDDLGDVLAGAGELARERLLAVAARCPAIAIHVYDESGSELEVKR